MDYWTVAYGEGASGEADAQQRKEAAAEAARQIVVLRGAERMRHIQDANDLVWNPLIANGREAGKVIGKGIMGIVYLLITLCLIGSAVAVLIALIVTGRI